MAPVKAYIHWVSAPCRAVIMTSKIAFIDMDLTFVDLEKGDQMKEDFLKINPDHCVPTIVDGDFTLWESRPITIYLIDKYAPGHDLFPKDLEKRANIHRMMDFDVSVYKAIGTYVYPRAFEGKESSPEEMEKMLTRLNDTVFNDKPYATGDVLTLADLFLISTITFPELVGYSVSEEKFPNLAAWVQRMKESEFYGPANAEFEGLKKAFQEKK